MGPLSSGCSVDHDISSRCCLCALLRSNVGCIIVCAPQIMVSLGLVLVGFLLVLGSLGVRCEFEVWGPFRFPGFPVNRFPHFRCAKL